MYERWPVCSKYQKILQAGSFTCTRTYVFCLLFFFFFYLGPSLSGPSFYKKMFYLWFMRFINLNSDPLKILGPRLNQDRTIQNAFDFFFTKNAFYQDGVWNLLPRTPHSRTPNVIRRRLFLSLCLSPLPLVHPHFVNVSASSEGSGESAHCDGSTELSSFKRDNFVRHYLYALCLKH